MKLLLFSLYKDEEDKDAFYVASFGVKLIKHGLSSKILTQLFWQLSSLCNQSRSLIQQTVLIQAESGISKNITRSL